MHTFKYSNSVPFNQMQSCAYLIIKKNKKTFECTPVECTPDGEYGIYLDVLD